MCHCGENHDLGCLQQRVRGVGTRTGSVKTGMMTKSQGKTQERGFKGPLSRAKGLDFVHHWAMTAQSLSGTHAMEELFWNTDADAEAMGLELLVE